MRANKNQTLDYLVNKILIPCYKHIFQKFEWLNNMNDFYTLTGCQSKFNDLCVLDWDRDMVIIKAWSFGWRYTQILKCNRKNYYMVENTLKLIDINMDKKFALGKQMTIN